MQRLRLRAQAGTLPLVARLPRLHQFGAFAGVVALAVIPDVLAIFATHLVLSGEASKEPARRAEAHIARARVLHGMSKDAWHRFGDAGYKHYQGIDAVRDVIRSK